MAHVLRNLSEEPGTEKIPECWSLDVPVVSDVQHNQRGWEAYWERLSDHQRIIREQAEEYVRKLQAVLPLGLQTSVLDFGCGFGFVARTLACRVGTVFLWDASANMRRCARVNVAGHPNVRFLDLSDAQANPRHLHFDLILVNSVAQYMSGDEFSDWLVRLRTMLSPGGRLVISDLIPPDYHSTSDIVDLLRFSKQHGFLARAIWQALGELVHYWTVRRRCPLYRIGREELNRRAQAVGLTMICLGQNLTHFKNRYTVLFTHAKTD